jgi:hypothetical protein
MTGSRPILTLPTGPGPIAPPRELKRFQRGSFAYPVNLTTCALGG